MLALYFAAWLFADVAPHGATCSILAYHRFGPVAADSMTTTTALFAQQIDALRASGYELVPLARLVEVVQRSEPVAHSLVAITIDDGHASVFTELLPVVRRLNVPVTLFIYPSAIGRASYALSWKQLRALADTPSFDIGAHTYWHPDFRRERQRLAPSAYTEFVIRQLALPRETLHQRLGVNVRFLAWPYGTVDNELQRLALRNGYAAAFALGNRNVSSADPLFALPRHLVVEAVGVQGLLKRLAQSPACVP